MQECPMNESIDLLIQVGMARLALGDALDALAYLDGALAEYGEAAAREALLNGRAEALRRLGRPSNGIPLEQERFMAGPARAGRTPCGLCSTPMRFFEHSHDKDWLWCPECGLVQYVPNTVESARLDQGEPSGAKLPPDSWVHRREEFFCNLFIKGLGWSDTLLYGIGWSLAFERLRATGANVVGCDLWRPLIAERRAVFGPKSFFHRDELPPLRFDLISAFEVFEHFAKPSRDVGFLVDHLKNEGAIFGCTDFWHGGSLDLHPSDDRTYWLHRSHVTAWGFTSMRRLARMFGLRVSFFKIDAGGVGAKVFFVLHRGMRTMAFVNSLPKVISGAY
jgi:hypothetical protein